MGQVVTLNGPSSAGKTTLARAVRQRMGPTCAALSIDQFFPFTHPESPNNWHKFSTLTDAMFAAAAALAAGGYDVVVDTVFERPDLVANAQRALVAHTFHLVAVTCALTVLEQREHARGDRRAGHARGQFERVLQGATYALVLDTSVQSVEECVDRIIALIG